MSKKAKKTESKESPSTNISSAPPPGILFLTNDSTSVIEISTMANDRYSEEIIRDAGEVFNLERLRGLQQDKNKFLEEAKIQINKLSQSIRALNVHTRLFEVTFLINLGYLLNEITPMFQNAGKCNTWLTHNCGRSPEYFQHARKLADMRDTAINYRALGVNRLLDVERLQRQLNKSLDNILKEHSFLDTTQDFGGTEFKAKVDAIITFYRFIDAGVDKDTLKFDDVHQMVQFTHEDIPVREVKRFKKHYDEATDKDKFVKQYVMDKGAITKEETGKKVMKESLNKLLADLNVCFENGTNDSEWVNKQKKFLDRGIFRQAYKNINWLRKKLKDHPHKSEQPPKKRKR